MTAYKILIINFLFCNSLNAFVPSSIEISASGGSNETDVKELIVIPLRLPLSSFQLTIVTPVAKCPKQFLKSFISICCEPPFFSYYLHYNENANIPQLVNLIL